MTDSPEVSLVHDSVQHVRQMIGDVGDIWRHEGLKKGVEQALYFGGSNVLGRWLLERVADEDPYFNDGLTTQLGVIELEGPVGLAAGWDKTGRAILGWQALGANHVTVGGITLYPQAGNSMPRLRTFDNRVGDHGASRSLNSFGFYSPGAAEVTYNIAKQRQAGSVAIPVIAQVTLNKEFYKEENRHMIPGILAETVRKVMPVADAINLGLSSPNTLGMREAQGREFTRINILAAKEVIGDSMMLGYKGDADGGEERLDMYCEVALETGLDYLELINTTGLEKIKAKYGAAHLPGGLAGADPEYQQMAREAVSYVYDAIGDQVDIMGMGGINSVKQAVLMMRAGARALGINTAVRELGGRAMVTLNSGLAAYVEGQPGINRVEQIIGIDTKRGLKAL